MVRFRPILAALSLAFWLSAVLSVATATDGTVDAVKRVLVVYENETTLPAAMEVAQGLYRGLDERLPTGFEIYSDYLDTVRFPGPDRERRLVDDMAAKYAGISLDAVMAVGPGALQFMLDNRSRIAAGVPLIFGAINDARLKGATFPPDVRGVVSHFDVVKTLDLARQLQPDAKKVVVLTGSADFDRGWATIAHEVLGGYQPHIEVEYLSGLSLEGFKEKAHDLPADVILLILTVFQDAEGKKFIPRNAAEEIAKASGAPAYGVYSTYVGLGVVGGFVETFESVGEDMAALAQQVMLGTASGPQMIRSTGRPLVDWRQMKRWGIDVAQLPPDAELAFYEPSVWERYRTEILATLAVIILQAGTIARLIAQGRRRRRVEQELTLERLELAHLSRTSQLGELSGAFAHELNQPLTSILANAEAGTRLLEKNPPDTPELKEIFGDIIVDDKRAAGVIAQLRRLMVKGETKLDRMNLNEAVTATIALARSELVARQTKLEFHYEQPELPVRGNLAQLQQVILNLVMNATDAMSHLAPSERRIVIGTRKRDDGFRELAISDRGAGLSPEMMAKAFTPFVSTKANGLGLGLAICRSIVQAHGGTLQFDTHKSDGARIVLALPPS